MKELDVLLESFLERKRDALEAGAYPEFEQLLGHEDDRLWDWVQGTADEPPADLSRLISELRRES